MFEIFHSNQEYMSWVIFFSLFMFIGTLVAVPYIISIIPHDYFLYEERKATSVKINHPVLRSIFFLLKNLAGVTLILFGIVMLVLPGQGILTIITGLVFVDFPNKYQLERWMISRPRVLKSINWLRARMRKPPLKLS